LKDDAASPALTLTIPISILVTNGPYLEVSPGGLQFVTEEGSEQTLTQYIGVTNGAPGPLPFLVYGNVQSGRNWLLLQTTSGTAQESPMPVEIQANTTGLAAGNYFAQIFIQGQGASNSDQVVEIALTVLPANATVLPSISPTGLIFTAGGDSNPASQTIQVSTPSSATMTLAATPAEDNGTGWLEITSSSESVSGSAPGSVTVAVNTGSLTAGVYTGSILLQLNSGSTYPVPVILVVPATSSPASAPLSAAKAVHSAAAQSACAPTQLLPLSTSLGSNFKVTAGLPVPLTVQVTDDCGNPLTSGSVIANFAGGDPTVTLIKSGNGTWTGTWWPRNVAGGLSAVVFNATLFSPSLSGTTAVAGSVAANASVPIVGSGRVLSAASYAPGTPLSPGSFVAIFGSNLASGTSVALGMPLSTTLAGTQVYLGSNLLPLQYVSPTQINAIVPYNAPVGAVQQLTVLRNGSPSPPETVIVTAAQPAVFTQDESGAGAASVVDVKPDGTQFVVTAANPASAGDTLLIYCTGLGAVTPAVPAGSVSPTGSPTNTTTLASVSIGGQTAQVSFSGLAPGYTGLYEVKAVVPSGISAGASVPLVVSMGSTSGGPVSSPPVTIAIQ
jgi:adhesin/invasin